MPGSCRGAPGCSCPADPHGPSGAAAILLGEADILRFLRPGCGALCALRAAHREKVAEVLLRQVASTELRKQGDLLELAVTLADDPTVIGDVLLALQSVEHQTRWRWAHLRAGGWRARLRDGSGPRLGRPGVRPIEARRIIARVGRLAARPLRCWSGSVQTRGTPGRERGVQGRADERAAYGAVREWPPDRGEEGSAG